MAESIYGWLPYRLYTFQRYPESAFFRPPQLASMGFYSSGRGEEVTCCGCGVTHASFQPRQNIRRAHIQSSPNCHMNFMQADDAGPADGLVSQDLPGPLPNEVRPIDNHLITYFSLELQTNVAFRRSDPNFNLLVTEGIRLRRRTFYDWPALYGAWEQLTTCGFFYTGILDTVQCFMCGIMYRAGLLKAQPDIRKAQCSKSCRPYFQ